MPEPSTRTRLIEVLNSIFEFVRKFVALLFPMDYGMENYVTAVGAVGFMVGAGIHVVINLETDETSKKKLIKTWLIISIIASFLTLSFYHIIYSHSGSTKLSLFLYAVAILLCVFGFFASISFLFFCVFRIVRRNKSAGHDDGKSDNRQCVITKEDGENDTP